MEREITNIDLHRLMCLIFFYEYVTNDRRRADLYPDLPIKGETRKTKGNVNNGRIIMSQFKHSHVTFAK